MAPTSCVKKRSPNSSFMGSINLLHLSWCTTPSKSALQLLQPLFLCLLLLSPLPSIAAAKFNGGAASSMGALASPGASSGSGGGSNGGNSLSAALSATGAMASAASAASSAVSAASGGGSPSVGATSNFLYSLMGAAAPSSVNPYPIRTMIGNMVWRLRQHRTPLMVIPPVLRLLYQFRGPIMTGFNSAFKGTIGSGGSGAAGAAAAAAKGVSDLASASSNLAGSAVGSNFAGAPLLFPGPSFGGGGGLPAGMMPVF